MTQTSSDYAPPRGRRPWSVSEVVAWVVIVSVVLFISVRVWREERAPAAAGENIQVTLAGKYLFALHELTHAATPAASRASSPASVAATGSASGVAVRTEVFVTGPGLTGDQLLRQVDEQAKTPGDKFRAAILAGEFKGKEEAIKRLDAVGAQGLAEDVREAKALYGGDAISPAEREKFRAKWGWFGDLAESFDAPAGDAVRERAVGSAYRVLFSILAVVFGGLIVGVAGLALLVVGIVLFANRRLAPAFGRVSSRAPELHLPADRRAYVQGVAIYLGIYGAASLAILFIPAVEKLEPLPRAALGLFFLVGAFVAGLSWTYARRESLPQWRAAMGLHAGRGMIREMLAGVVGYIAGVPVVVVGALLTILLSKLAGVIPTHPIERELNGSSMELAAVYLLACVWAPVTEELMFRGALFAHMRERFGWWISALAVSVVFALIHPQGWTAAPALVSIAVVLAGIREWRGSIVGSMTAHAMHNFVATTIGILLLRNF